MSRMVYEWSEDAAGAEPVAATPRVGNPVIDVVRAADSVLRTQMVSVQIMGSDRIERARAVAVRRAGAQRLTVAYQELRVWARRYADVDELREILAFLEPQLAAMALCQ